MRKIEVVEYDPVWPNLFVAESILIGQSLGNVAVAIHHIGSTAVPNLSAKPVIDMLIEVTDLDALDGNMQAIGYAPEHEFGIPGRRYFHKCDDESTYHVHAFVSGDFNLTRHIAFRDYLRTHPAIAQAYGHLKKTIASTCNNDINKYCDGKASFIKLHEAIAIEQELHKQPRNK